VEKQDNQQQKQPAGSRAGAGEPQTDLAEGELDTVEESIRAHERKGDLPHGDSSEDAAKK
jgi:hypothetical protein